MPVLENWGVSKREYREAKNNPDFMWKAPEEFYYYVLVGNVYGHPVERHYDGKRIMTSRIKSYDQEEDVFITSSGTKYYLGVAHEEYQTMVEDPKQSLINWLTKED